MSILHNGDVVGVVAPALSLAGLADNDKKQIENHFNSWGLKIKYAPNCKIQNIYGSSSVQERISDLNLFFLDNKIKLIWCAKGGSNCNQLLAEIDYNLLKSNPKPMLGYSDLTILLNAIYHKTGIINFYAPNYHTLRYVNKDDETFCMLKTILMETYQTQALNLPSSQYWIINHGKGSGISIGGNLPSFQLLQGTQYMPSLKNKILFLEYDDMVGEYTLDEFDRDLESLLLQNNSNCIRGLIIGKFPVKTQVDREKLTDILLSKSILKHIPVIANVDFGHVLPFMPIPIGGRISINTEAENIIMIQKD